MAKQKYKSDISEAIHSSVSAMYRVGTIDKATMREFDESCLAAPPALEPKRIKRIRERQRVSQPVFARYLNTSQSTRREVGVGRPEAQRHGAEAVGHRRKAWAEDAGMSRIARRPPAKDVVSEQWMHPDLVRPSASKAFPLRRRGLFKGKFSQR